MATFFCRTSGVTAFWLVNGSTVDRRGNAELIQKGWIFNECADLDFVMERNNVFSLTLQIPTLPVFNNTEIRCVSIINSPMFSERAHLIIKSKLHYALINPLSS